ncbi:hydroxylase/desaturase asaB [Colletotrichum spaethianum]|uniref:Hydroxylase/desaturase asaB n=1 Tax=Colletotrichum spaethianum TaxID=700344 RepID=A0AA37UMY5_9PEZI|nr:hydroxylase/desaturase asaB [Colletotrichum spaethianum]GKT47430.1 hydroxylase/desaturase asaB [Colletotrichum spaethianum]
MPHSTEKPESIEAYVNYHLPPPKGEPYPIQMIATIGFQRTKYDRQLVPVTDMRTCDEEFGLDKQGFKVVESTIQEKQWDGDYRFGLPPQLQRDVQELLMRQRDPHENILNIPDHLPDSEVLSMQPPAMFIHVEIVLNRLPEAEMLRGKTKTRWGIVNVWQPLKSVRREPLAVCDARSVEESDLRPVTTRIVIGKPPNTMNKDNEQWHMVASPQHKWYYASNMNPDEALLIKIFDTKLDGRARRVPHTAIQTPKDEGPPRESIEIRCLVFWENQDL